MTINTKMTANRPYKILIYLYKVNYNPSLQLRHVWRQVIRTGFPLPSSSRFEIRLVLDRPTDRVGSKPTPAEIQGGKKSGATLRGEANAQGANVLHSWFASRSNKAARSYRAALIYTDTG